MGRWEVGGGWNECGGKAVQAAGKEISASAGQYHLSSSGS